ncbi:hypothetical protein [Haloferula sp. BvORR071]|uniref:hypothetical protein n=1 Tax=Haloferula sp. BvORR071 TaxID=1396141 RepID=UPI0005579E88|nr:hypothetical protein [Haloferula sp. BvORR071]
MPSKRTILRLLALVPAIPGGLLMAFYLRRSQLPHSGQGPYTWTTEQDTTTTVTSIEAPVLHSALATILLSLALILILISFFVKPEQRQ